MNRNIFDKLSHLIDGIREFIADHVGIFGNFFVALAILILYFIVGSVQGEMVDRVSTVFNLIAGIFLVITFTIKILAGTFGIEQKKKNSKIFPIILLAILILSFIIGLARPMPSIFLNFVYNGVFSGLAAITWPVIIYFIIYTLIVSKNKKEEIKDVFGQIIWTFVISFIFSMVASLIFSYNGNLDVFNNVATYKNTSYTQERENLNIDTFMKEELEKDAKAKFESKKSLSVYQNLKDSGASEDELNNRLIEAVHNTLSYSTPSSLQDKGYKIISFKRKDDTNVILDILDKETNKNHLYYIVDYKTFNVSNSSVDEYNSIP